MSDDFFEQMFILISFPIICSENKIGSLPITESPLRVFYYKAVKEQYCSTFKTFSINT